MLEDIKGQQAKFATIQNSIQSRDIELGCVGFCSVCMWLIDRDHLNRISALLAGDKETKAAVASSGVRLQLKNGSMVQQHKSGREVNVGDGQMMLWIPRTRPHKCGLYLGIDAPLYSSLLPQFSFMRQVIMHTPTTYMEAFIPCHIEIEHSGQCPDTA